MKQLKIAGILLLIFGALAILLLKIFLRDRISEKGIAYDQYLNLVNTYNHNPTSFTQGIFFYKNELFESVGQYKKSKLFKDIDLSTGLASKSYSFPDDIFAEGSCVMNDKLYVLTWQENVVHVFDPDTLELDETLKYPREGWGLTTDGEYLIASDGSSSIFFMDENLKVQRKITIRSNGKEISGINELEYIDGEIWANVFVSDKILLIDPQTGEVNRIINFKGLYKGNSLDIESVLNGIAYDQETGYIYITGKRWKKIFEFQKKDMRLSNE